MQTNIAVLGAGRWGIHLIRNFLAHQDARIVAVVDPHVERLQQCQEQLALNTDILLTTDWLDVFKIPELQAIAIATPASTHYRLISAALKQGYHILAEKPLTVNLSEAIELCRLAEKQQRQLFLDHTYLFHPAVTAGKTALQQHKLGELRYGYATRTNLGPVRRDVDVLWDLAIHDIAIFNHWLGETPAQVQAVGSNWLQSHPIETTSLSPNPQIPAEQISDLAWLTLTYPSGFQAFIHISWLNPDKQRKISIVGSQGTLIFDEMLSATPLIIQHGYFEQTGNLFTPKNQHLEVLKFPLEEPLKQVCHCFLDSIRHQKPSPISSGWVGAKLVQILSCLSASLQQGGKTIRIMDDGRLK